MTEDAPAQDGTDAFSIGAGAGNGMTGGAGPGGFRETAGAYGEYARSIILAAVKASRLLHDKDFIAGVRVWFSAQGEIAKVEVIKSSGTETYDSEIQRVLAALQGFRPPSPGVLAQMPIQFNIDERHSL
jgi:TonB family protein